MITAMADDDDPESQAVRRATLRNDRLVREQAGTLYSHAISEANEGAGRFTAQSRATVVGATAAPAPVAAPNWAHDPSGPEPPLGVDINALEPTGTPTEIAQSLIDNSELEPGAAARTFAGRG